MVRLKLVREVKFTIKKKTPPEQIEYVCKTFRPFFNGILIANDSFTP